MHLRPAVVCIYGNYLLVRLRARCIKSDVGSSPPPFKCVVIRMPALGRRRKKVCFVCDRIEMIKKGTNPYFVKELETGYVVIGDHQHFYGYTLFLYKNHNYTELFQLDINERTKFMQEMTIVAEAVSKAFNAEKMNYELLGMGDAHLHWHLFPRRQGDIENYGNNGKGPAWCYPMEKIYSDDNRPSKEELEKMKQKLLTELDNLL